LGRALWTCPKADEPLLHSGRHRGGFPFPRNDLGAQDVVVPGILAIDIFYVGICLSVGPGASVLDALTRSLVIVADSILRERAGLAIYLIGAFTLIFEGCDQLVFILTRQHAHGLCPVKTPAPQFFGPSRRFVAGGLRAPPLRMGRWH